MGKRIADGIAAAASKIAQATKIDGDTGERYWLVYDKAFAVITALWWVAVRRSGIRVLN